MIFLRTLRQHGIPNNIWKNRLDKGIKAAHKDDDRNVIPMGGPSLRNSLGATREAIKGPAQVHGARKHSHGMIKLSRGPNTTTGGATA